LPLQPTLFPYTTLFRSVRVAKSCWGGGFPDGGAPDLAIPATDALLGACAPPDLAGYVPHDPDLAGPPDLPSSRDASDAEIAAGRSEEHTSELQSPCKLV